MTAGYDSFPFLGYADHSKCSFSTQYPKVFMGTSVILATER